MQAEVSKSREAGSLSWEFIQVVMRHRRSSGVSRRTAKPQPELRDSKGWDFRVTGTGLLSLLGTNPLPSLHPTFIISTFLWGQSTASWLLSTKIVSTLHWVALGKKCSFLKHKDKHIEQRKFSFLAFCQQRLRWLPFLFLCLWFFFLSGRGRSLVHSLCSY